MRRREINLRFEQCPDDWDLVGLSIDEVQIIKRETEVAEQLARWGVGTNTLTLPHHFGDLF